MKSEFRYTKKVIDEAARYKLNPDELAITDLVIAGWPKDVAYKLIYRVGETWSPAAVKKEASEVLAKAGSVRRRYEHDALKKEEEEETKEAYQYQREKEREAVTGTEKELLNAVSKENMLLDLVKARKRMVAGSKDWLDINKMIAELTRMKQDEVKTEDTTVHFYLPMQCHQCSLYAQQKSKEKELDL